MVLPPGSAAAAGRSCSSTLHAASTNSGQVQPVPQGIGGGSCCASPASWPHSQQDHEAMTLEATPQHTRPATATTGQGRRHWGDPATCPLCVPKAGGLGQCLGSSQLQDWGAHLPSILSKVIVFLRTSRDHLTTGPISCWQLVTVPAHGLLGHLWEAAPSPGLNSTTPLLAQACDSLWSG